jgi:hypothetical protein
MMVVFIPGGFIQCIDGEPAFIIGLALLESFHNGVEAHAGLEVRSVSEIVLPEFDPWAFDEI